MLKKTALLILWLALAVAARATINEDAFLYAIRVVETGDRAHARGSKGERGAYQFRRHVWYQHTSTNFNWAYDRETSTTVARWHLGWLKETLSSYGIKPSAWNLALAWNAGVGAVQNGTAPRRSRDYANRVVNMMGTVAVAEVPIVPIFRISTEEPTPDVSIISVSTSRDIDLKAEAIRLDMTDESPRVVFLPDSKISQQLRRIFADNTVGLAYDDDAS